MSRFKNDALLTEQLAPVTFVQTGDRPPSNGEPAENCAERRPLPAKASGSFLIILLRALSAWGV